MKHWIKTILIILIIFYFVLYFSYRNGYYIDRNKEKMMLTEEKIKEYEDDLKNGVDVSQKDYVIITNHYDNNYTRASLRVSKKIEKGIDKIIKFFFKKIGDTINE